MKPADIIKEVSSIIRKELSHNTELFLFGSFAKGNNLSTSDIDIAIKANKKIPFGKMVKIRSAIDNILTLRSIDLVDLLNVDKPFMENILKYAKKI